MELRKLIFGTEEGHINIKKHVTVAHNLTTCVSFIHVLTGGGDAAGPGVAV